MKKFYFILLISTLLCACSKDEMDRTIFIWDENDGNLPAYTEWGYNSFGAEYERVYFLATHSIVPCKIIYRDNQVQFSLNGRVSDYYGEEMSLIFAFPATQTYREYYDLVGLNDVKIDLVAANCTVKMAQGNQEAIPLDVIGGELHFKRAQLLKIDDVVNRVILSGTFELRFLKNNFPTYLSNGRFDLGITKKDFYTY